MNELLREIKVLIWDFDGTLYKQIPALLDNIRDTEIQVIVKHTGWSEKKAKEEFYKIYGVTTPSGTTAVSQIAHIPHDQSSRETSALTNYKNSYIQNQDCHNYLSHSLCIDILCW